MVHDRSSRRTPWSWIIGACLAAGLGAIACLQFRVDRENHGLQVAWLAAANQQLALTAVTQSAVEQYVGTHNFGDPAKPTLEQFCKDRNGGRPLGKDGIWQDPATGGKVRIVSGDHETFAVMPDYDLPPRPVGPYSDAIRTLRNRLEGTFSLACLLLCITCLVTFGMARRRRIVLGQWLVCSSFSLTFLTFLGKEPERWWGLGFLVIGGLYLAGTMFFGRQTDPTPRCAKCRYNLTGNAGGICPECGTPVALA